jgi:hypothetical protein
MARKRGGLAGLYDRNKGVIKALAPIALGAIPGAGVPLAIAAGAALGADREGKGYFKGLASREGLTGAALGGLSGYAGGKLGQSAAQGVRGMLTAQKLNSLQPMDMTSKIGITPGTVSATPPVNPTIGMDQLDLATKTRPAALQYNYKPPLMEQAAPTRAAAAPRVTAPTTRAAAPSLVNQPGPLNRFADLPTINRSVGITNPADAIRTQPGKFGRFADTLRKNKDIIEMGAKGLQQALPNPDSEAALMNAETTRMRFEEERNRLNLEEERRRRIANLLMPYFQQQFPSLQQSPGFGQPSGLGR